MGESVLKGDLHVDGGTVGGSPGRDVPVVIDEGLRVCLRHNTGRRGVGMRLGLARGGLREGDRFLGVGGVVKICHRTKSPARAGERGLGVNRSDATVLRDARRTGHGVLLKLGGVVDHVVLAGDLGHDGPHGMDLRGGGHDAGDVGGGGADGAGGGERGGVLHGGLAIYARELDRLGGLMLLGLGGGVRLAGSRGL